jgi:hypothetical protein
MRNAGLVLVAILGVTVSLGAQGRGNRDRDRTQGVPPGHLPPPGECRVWYDGRPPGQQPRPTDCRNAERIAARDRDARVIYGSTRYGRSNRDDDDRRGRDDDRDRDDDRRAIPRFPYPDQGRYPDRGRQGRDIDRVPFNNGYEDGLDAGREDARRNRSDDPDRHSHYRAANRGYDSRYGSREAYRDRYREGFRAGYEDGYDDEGGTRRRGGIGFPWPF